MGLSGATGGDEFALRTLSDTEEYFSPLCLRLLGRVCVIEMVNRTIKKTSEVICYLL